MGLIPAGTPSITPLAVGLVLISTLSHTAWNTALKRQEEKRSFNAGLLLCGSLWGAGPALWRACHGGHVPWIPFGCALVTSLIWLVYYSTLGRSYTRGDLSVAYPVSRGVSPVAAAALGLLMGERPTALGALGIVAVVLSVWFISGAPRRWHELCKSNVREAAFVGVLSAIYTAIDKWAVHRCDQVIYLWLTFAFGGLWLTLRAARGCGLRQVAERWRTQLPTLAWASLADWGTWTLVLSALKTANLMYVVPLRATAVLWTVLVGGMTLGEGRMWQRMGWGALMVLGVLLMALAG